MIRAVIRVTGRVTDHAREEVLLSLLMFYKGRPLDGLRLLASFGSVRRKKVAGPAVGRTERNAY